MKKISQRSYFFFQHFPACCCAFRSEIHDNDWITLPSLWTIVFRIIFLSRKNYEKLRSKNYYSILISLFPSFRLDIDISIEILASDSLNIHEKLINAIDSGRLFIYIQKGFHLYHETLLIWIFIVQQNIDILKWLIITKLNYSKISNIFNNYWIIFNLLYIENLEFKTIYIYITKNKQTTYFSLSLIWIIIHIT